MPSRDVVLWHIDEEILDGEERRAAFRITERVTDVFYRALRPKPGSLLLGVHRPLDGDYQLAVELIGVVSAFQAVATGKDRVLVTPLLRLRPPVPVSRLHAPEAQRRRLKDHRRTLGPLKPARLSPQVGEALVAALRQLSPEAARWLAAVRTSDMPVTGAHAARLREERDAVQLAIDISGVAAPADALHTAGMTLDDEAPFGATFNPLFVIDNEDDLIAEDLRRFDPRSELLPSESSSVTRFVSGGFALTVMNVNRKPLEHALGVDLVYWDQRADIYTMVQYKRLGKRPRGHGDGDRWAYMNRDDLADQLRRMNLGPQNPATSRDWRLASSPFWFKFVKTTDFTPRDRFVLKGMYVPADYLRLAIEDGSLRTGARGGFEVTYSNTRYLAREVFVELVRRGFAGTTASGSEQVVAIAAQRAQANEVIVAMKTPAREDETWSHVNLGPNVDLPF